VQWTNCAKNVDEAARTLDITRYEIGLLETVPKISFIAIQKHA
jgi:hypothetical protein